MKQKIYWIALVATFTAIVAQSIFLYHANVLMLKQNKEIEMLRETNSTLWTVIEYNSIKHKD